MIHETQVRAVRHFLLNSGAADGARLPTERALAQDLGLSRGVIRGALAIMESEGHILRKVGSGTYRTIRSEAGAHTSPAPMDANPRQIMEARFAFEPYIAGMAALNCTKQDMETLKACAEAYHRAEDFFSYETADENFHAAIAAATHNPVVVRAYQTFNAAHAATEWGGLRQRFLNTDRRAASRQEHDHILDAIRSRDADAAIRAARQHLKHIVSALLDR